MDHIGESVRTVMADSRKKVYSIYDSKAKAYRVPFIAVNDGMAIRMVQNVCYDTSSDLWRFGADFTLFEIGFWDEFSGRIEMHEAFLNLGTALDIQQRKESYDA